MKEKCPLCDAIEELPYNGLCKPCAHAQYADDDNDRRDGDDEEEDEPDCDEDE